MIVLTIYFDLNQLVSGACDRYKNALKFRAFNLELIAVLYKCLPRTLILTENLSTYQAPKYDL